MATAKSKNVQLPSNNPQGKEMTALLIGNQYKRQWAIPAPSGVSSILECWTGTRGVVLIQIWESEGINIYSESAPNNWGEIAKWLRLEDF